VPDRKPPIELPVLELSPDNVRFEFSMAIACDDPHLDYVTRFKGVALLDDPDAEAPLELCQAEGHRLNFCDALNQGVDLEQLFDSLSAELSDFYRVAFRPDGSGRLRTTHGTHPAGEICNLVYVDQIEVRPEARGMGIGSRMVRRLVRALDAGDSLVALKAFPLSDEGEEAQGREAREKQIRRVKRFYSALGFEPVGEEFMVADARTFKSRLAGRRQPA
jgi:GNAT superfamily N-acetyltransferase